MLRILPRCKMRFRTYDVDVYVATGRRQTTPVCLIQNDVFVHVGCIGPDIEAVVLESGRVVGVDAKVVHVWSRGW